MTETEEQLLDCLLALEHEAQSMRTASSKTNLLPLFSRIDKLAGELPPDSDRQLLHYLQSKSYEKARLLLQGHNR